MFKNFLFIMNSNNFECFIKIIFILYFITVCKRVKYVVKVLKCE